MASEQGLMERIKKLFAKQEEEFTRIFEHRVSSSVLGAVYTSVITLILAFNDPDESLDEMLNLVGNNGKDKDCRAGFLTGYHHPAPLISVIYAAEYCFLGLAIKLDLDRRQLEGSEQDHRHDQAEANPESPVAQQPRPINWASNLTALSALKGWLCRRPLEPHERIILRMSVVHLSSVAPVFVLGPPGIGAYVISTIIEKFIFLPREDGGSSTFYQLEDTGSLARIVLYIGFLTNYNVGNEMGLKYAILFTIAWQLFKRLLRYRDWTQRFSQGFDTTLLILAAIFLLGRDCPANSSVYALLLTLSPVNLVSLVHIVVVWIYVLLLAPVGRLVVSIACQLGGMVWRLLCILWHRLKSIAPIVRLGPQQDDPDSSDVEEGYKGIDDPVVNQDEHEEPASAETKQA